MAVCVIVVHRVNRQVRGSRSNLFEPACPARPCSIIALHADANARRYTKSNARVYPPGDTAISWIKFRVAVNLGHLLRHGKHNFKLSFANKHGPWRAERFLYVPFSPPPFRINSCFPLSVNYPQLMVALKRVIYTWPFANCSLCLFYLSGGAMRFFRIFYSQMSARCAIIERWKLHRNSPIDE